MVDQRFIVRDKVYDLLKASGLEVHKELLMPLQTDNTYLNVMYIKSDCDPHLGVTQGDQTYKASYVIEVYCSGLSDTVALECQELMSKVRQTLMLPSNTFLGMRGIVGSRRFDNEMISLLDTNRDTPSSRTIIGRMELVVMVKEEAPPEDYNIWEKTVINDNLEYS